MRFLLGLFLSAISACLFFLSLPPYNYGFLAWFALVPLIIAQYRIATSNFKASFFLYVAFVIAGGVSMYNSIPAMNLGFGDLRQWVVVGVAVASLFVLMTGLPSGTKRFHEKTNFKFFIILPVCCWVGFEFLRYLLELGQMWCMFFISQHQNLAIIQLSSLLGMWLVTAVVTAVNYLLGYSLLKLLDGQYRSFQRHFVTAALVFSLSHLLGWGLLQEKLVQTGSIKLAAIQKGTSFEASSHYYRSDRLTLTRAMLVDYEKLTDTAAKQNPDLVVWPESVVWVSPHKHESIMQRLQSVAKRNKVYLVVAYIDEEDERGIVNEAMVFSPEGNYLGAYAKSHPIILPNYIDGSVTRGSYPVFDLDLGRIGIGKMGIVIGYDIDFSDSTRKLVNNGAQLLAIPMHDRPAFWQNQFLHNKYRAAENRVTMVRADWRHASTIIDPFGRPMTNPLIHNEPAAVILEVPLYEGGSLYTKLGDIFAYLCFVAMLFFLGWQLRSRTLPLSRNT